MFVNSPVGIYNICECFLSLVAGVHNRCDVDTYDWHAYVLSVSFDTSLLLFLKRYVDKPINSDGMLKHL